MSSLEAKRVENRYRKKLLTLDNLCSKQIQGLWKKHDSLKGAKENHVRAGIIGKIVGIEWVTDTLKSLEHKEERELEKHDARRY